MESTAFHAGFATNSACCGRHVESLEFSAKPMWNAADPIWNAVSHMEWLAFQMAFQMASTAFHILLYLRVRPATARWLSWCSISKSSAFDYGKPKDIRFLLNFPDNEFCCFDGAEMITI